jgi:hypothetical protein
VSGQSATLYLMPDGAYEVRAGSDAPLARDASLAALILSVAGTPGTPMKLVHRPAAGGTIASAQFLSTSVSGWVTLQASPLPYRSVITGGPSTYVIGPVGMPVYVPGVISETLYTVPTVSELVAALRDGGAEVHTFDRDLLLVRPEGKEVGRVFDDTGLRKVVLTAQNTFRLTGEAGAVLWEGADLLTALLGSGPRLGLRRLPARLVGKSQVYLYGLARGGTAVFDVGGQTTLDPLGNVNTLPGGSDIAERLRQAGVEFVGYDV